MDRKRKQLQNGPLFGRIFVSYFVLQEWQELEMKLDDKINKVEARNVQLEEKYINWRVNCKINGYLM